MTRGIRVKTSSVIVVGMLGNPYDVHTQAETLAQMGILTGLDKPPTTTIMNKSYWRDGDREREHPAPKSLARHYQSAQSHD